MDKQEIVMLEQCESVRPAMDKLAELGGEGTHHEHTTAEERKLVWKMDLLILPLLSGSILFAYLDRGQIGNARIMGLEEDIGVTDKQFYNCLMLFFAGYMLVELAGGMLLRVCHPRWVLGGSCLCFGLFATCMAAVKGYAPLMVLRLLLGIAEGTGYGVYLYASMWYNPYELSKRVATIYGMSPIAGAVSGIIAYAVNKDLDNVSGYHAWQWLFIIEGGLTMFFGLLIMIFLPGLPDTTAKNGHFLFRNVQERAIIARRSRSAHNDEGSKLRYHQLWIAVKDIKDWLSALVMGSWGVCIGAFGVFLPTFIKEFGFAPLTTQLYSMIPYAFGFVSLCAISWVSDRLKHKTFIILGCYLTTIVGFIILLTTTNRVALVAGLCIVLIGVYPGVVVTVAYTISIHGGFLKRALVIWFSQVFIQGYSMVATQVYDTPPRFYKGHGVGLALCALAIISLVLLWLIMAKANRDRERRAREFEARGEIDPQMEQSFEDLCDFHPAWRYAL